MKETLQILHLEDDEKDAEMVFDTLEAAGICQKLQRVDTRRDFEAAIELGGIDLILSDYALPAFDGMAALNIARTKCPDVPFILLSGTLGEECAIESLRSGATDYVLKGRLSRLVPAVRRALQEIEHRAERRRLEQQFVQAQKMELVGQFAGGVAHDFNNILSVIMGYSDMMLNDLQPGDPMHEPMEVILHASERAAALTRQLLIFSRKQQLQPEVIDAGEVVTKMEGMLRQLINEDISLTIACATNLGHINADPGYVSQVLMNLAVNARDAMPGGGRLQIEVRNVFPEEIEERNLMEVPPGNYVLLAVQDTGTGMSDEVKAHIFEAFFTTKPKDRGTGLGLATCQSIVKQSGGYITVESALGKGTRFGVYFPWVNAPLKNEGRPCSKGVLPRGTETIMVVEDQHAVRDLACTVLRKQGYTVLPAINGEDGLRVAAEYRETPIGLVITDVIMPQMGGKVMVEWLKTTYPDLRILFTSGYTDDAISHHGVLNSGVAYLPKPYTPALLAEKVREMLDAEP